MCGWIALALAGLPIAYLLQKKYKRGWGLSILGGMAFLVFAAAIILFITAIFNAH
jgi:ABC-type multidrug transport system permease subunit